MIVYKELKSIEGDLGFPARTLYALSNNLKNHYKTVEIPKRDGGVRKLSVPSIILKRVQRSIVDKILVYEPISSYATAYRYGATVQKNAACHVGNKKILKLDILHFFDSIYYSAVKDRVFNAERFSESVRVLLTMLCYYKDALPQGAPTSPAITNIIMREFDETVGAWCEERGISYTRYCDDMTFSGDFDGREVKDFVKSELLKNHLLLNEKKTVLATKGTRQSVTGIVVNEKLNVSSEYRRKIRQEVYFCLKFGVEEHIKRLGKTDADKYLHSLLGKINFVLQTRGYDRFFADAKESIVKQLKNIN